MESSWTRLVVCATLITLGVVLMLLGIFWVMVLGLALITLSAVFSSREPQVRSIQTAAFLLFSLTAIGSLLGSLHNGDAFVQKTRLLWFWVLMVTIWLGTVTSEFLQCR